ncbi:unnamed protein product [Amoebophrya sp. A25]|nr:unnamed protein product [Amoebophrya sp. A25]|eukprot:GSA25T00001655001.1
MFDIAWNVTDDAFHGRGKYEPDADVVLKRAVESGVQGCIICGGSVEDSAKGLEICEKLDPSTTSTTAGDSCQSGRSHQDLKLFQTVGVHPTRCADFEPERDLGLLRDLIQGARPKNRVVAFGEFGLDYDRLQFCSKEAQQAAFRAQLGLARELALPLYLHCRGDGCWQDLKDIMMLGMNSPATAMPNGGVVHSFTGTLEELKELLDFGLDVGVNGCSLKTEENCEVAASIPLDRLHLETDAPYCDIRSTHASSKHLTSYTTLSKDHGKQEYAEQQPGESEPVEHTSKNINLDLIDIPHLLQQQTLNQKLQTKKFDHGKMLKGRNEPCRVLEVAQVLASLKQLPLEKVLDVTARNTRRLFRIA